MFNGRERLRSSACGLFISERNLKHKEKEDEMNANGIVNRRTLLTLAAAVTVGGLTAAFTAMPRATPVSVTVNEKPLQRNTVAGLSYSSVVKRVTPSVVKVLTSGKAKHVALEEFPGLDDPMFRRFFGDGFGPGRSGSRAPAPRQHGLGSGVIVSKDGYILTNNHVVDGADEVKVAFQDGREFTAKVVGRDPRSDVAVLKVEAKDLPHLELADSEKVEVGDVVLAIGNPFGIGQTVTMGIVSATGRGAMGLDYEDFIQTDASINPGNSGGALVDTEGRLIGINTAILSRSGGNQGIGFAIPANMANSIMTSLVKDGRVSRGYMGVMIQDVTHDLASEFKLKDNAGALVSEVSPNGPAAKAGLKSGDVVVEFNGKKVESSRQLKLRVAQVAPGSLATLKVLRDGASSTLTVKMQELPGEPKLAKASAAADGDNGVLNGVAVADLNSGDRRERGIPAHVKGALVTGVEPGSPAAEAGLKPGDLIQEINRKPVKNADEAVSLTEHETNKKTLLKVWSQGGSHYVVVDESHAG
jgi:serine protease Do